MEALTVTIAIEAKVIDVVQKVALEELGRHLTADEVKDFVKEDVEWWLEEGVVSGFNKDDIGDSFSSWAATWAGKIPKTETKKPRIRSEEIDHTIAVLESHWLKWCEGDVEQAIAVLKDVQKDMAEG